MARALHPLTTKIALRVEEPLSYKGGRLVRKYKGKNCPTICNHWRELLVSNFSTKTWHRHIRQLTMPFLKSYREGCAYAHGGRGTEMCMHHPRLAQRS